MARFLAVYTMKPEDFAAFRRLSKAEQDAIDAVGIEEWRAWEKRTEAHFVDRGGMVGGTTRVTRQGISSSANQICGYLVVEAESAEAAARLFEDHPHVSTFPGDTVDIMPLVT